MLTGSGIRSLTVGSSLYKLTDIVNFILTHLLSREFSCASSKHKIGVTVYEYDMPVSLKFL